MRRRRISVNAVLAFLLALVARSVTAGPIDPLLKFEVIRTQHFNIYFHQGEEPLARRLADVAERANSWLAGILHSQEKRRTDVVLLDQAEEANGWATPLPRDTVVLNAAAPSGSEFIGNTSDWLETVFLHEYTHILHLDRSRGWARVARALFGRTPVAFPNLWLPQWQIEGIATLEETVSGTDGRLAAGDFRAVLRKDLLASHRLTLDRASGGLVGWPDGQAAYVAGLEFHDYLRSRFGPETFPRLADATAGRLPYFGSGAFKKVFGQPLGELWRDYTSSRTPAAAATKDPEIRQVTHQGEIVLAPRFSGLACDGCPREIVYASRTPHAFPTLRSVSTTGENDRALTTRYLGTTTAVTPDFLLFDQQDLHRSVALLSDVYALDRRTGDVTRLSYGARLQDPDVTKDGKRLVAVREERGRRDLVVADVDRDSPSGSLRLNEIRVLASQTETQYSAPRWSPDGDRIAVERRRLGQPPMVVVLDALSGMILNAWGGGETGTRVVTPAWRPDGRAVVAAFSMATSAFDLFELPLDPATGTALRLTYTSLSEGAEGATWPDVSPDGREIAFVGYTASGYDVFVTPYRTDRPWANSVMGLRPNEVAAASARLADLRDVAPPAISAAKTYSPWSTLPPTSWTPLLQTDSFQTRLGGFVTGADVLSRHAYTVAATWLTQRGYLTSPLPSGPDWSASYAYTRWQPTYFGSLSRETQFRRLAATSSSAASNHAVVRHEAEVGVLWPLTRIRQNSRAFVSMVDTRASDLLDDRTVDARLVSTRFAFAHDTSHRYGYSISREQGVSVGGTVELTRRALGGVGNADTATIDGRAYLPGLDRHHVVAVRATAANTTGDNAARQSFELGVVSASPSVIDFGSDAVGLFRGNVAGAGYATRFAAANIEYRLPLKTIERGYGTVPLMLRTLHMAAFVDLLQAKEITATTTQRTAAIGAELSMDGVVGYSLPGAVSVGAAWTMPRRDGARDVRAYVRLGRAF